MDAQGRPTPDHLAPNPRALGQGIGIVGAGFIVRDCHLVAYAQAGFPVVGLTSRTEATAREVAGLRGVGTVYPTVEAMLDDPRVTVVDVAVPPLEQPGVIRRILAHPRKPRGILAQKPLAMAVGEARSLVEEAEAAGVRLQVNQNMRHDHSVRVLKGLLDRGDLGEPVLATIEMRAIPHWMPWAEGGRSLSTFIMSIHHLDTFRYWLGEPDRVLASTRRDPRTKFAHDDGINLYILEYPNEARASAWDDVWAGPAREGAGPEIAIRWRFEGTRGLALGTIGWPSWPARTPSTIDYSTVEDGGRWHRPRWPEAWFPDAFAGTMAGLLRAIEDDAEPDISGRDHLKTLALAEAVLAAGREHRATRPSEFLGGRPSPAAKSGGEILGMVLETIANVYRRPEMYATGPDGVDDLLWHYHSLWVRGAGLDQDAYLAAIGEAHGGGHRCSMSFSDHYRFHRPGAPEAEDDEVIRYVIETWKELDARLGIDPSPAT